MVVVILNRAVIVCLHVQGQLSLSHLLGHPLDRLFIIILITSDNADPRLSPFNLRSCFAGKMASRIVILSILDALVLSVRLISCLGAGLA